MKIEKINDNQIKCTLTRSDLASHQLRISELAYGTEKANGLFRDMMDKASLELGFDVDDFPVSIEAIPVSMDCIILMITKLEEPDEVDPDYSGLTVLKELFSKDTYEDSPVSSNPFSSDDLSMNLFAQLDALAQESASHRKTEGSSCLLSFDRLETVIQFAHQLAGHDFRDSSLYKSADQSRYYLFLEPASADAGDLTYISTAGTEFGRLESSSPSRTACVKEHCECLMAGDAVPRLISLFS